MTPPSERRPAGRGRLVLAAAVLLALGLVWGPTGKFLLDGRNEIERRAQDDIALELATVRAALGGVFAGTEALLRLVASEARGDPAAVDLDRLLAEAPLPRGMIAFAQIADSLGRPLRSSTASTGASLPAVVGHLDLLVHAPTGMVVGAPTIAYEGASWTIPAARVLRDASGRVVGSVGVHVDPQRLGDALSGFAPRDRVIVAHRDGRQLLAFGEPAEIGNAHRRTAALAGAPITVSVERSRAAIESEWRRQATSPVAAAGGASLAIGGLAFVIGRRRRFGFADPPGEHDVFAGATAARALSDGLFAWQAGSPTMTLSPQMKATIGLDEPAGEFPIKIVQGYLHPEDREEILSRLGALLAGGALVSRSVWRLRHRDGHFRHYEFRIAIERDASGAARRLVGSMAERRLTTGEAARDTVGDPETAETRRLAEILDTLGDGYILYDAQDKLVLCNAKYRELYPAMAEIAAPGMTVREMTEACVANGLVDTAPLTAEQWAARRLEEHANPQGSVLHHLKDGRWILRREKRLPDGSSIMAHTDITEQKRGNIAIEDRMRLFATMLDNIGQGVVVYDREQRLVYCNRRYVELLGLPRDLFLPGTPLADVVRQMVARGDFARMRPDHELRFARIMEMMAHWPRPFIAEWIQANGMTLQSHISDLPGGQSLLVMADITERKRHETEIETQRTRLEAIIANAPIAIAVFDKTERLALRNAQYVAMAAREGIDPAPGRTLADLIAALVDARGLDPDAARTEVSRWLDGARQIGDRAIEIRHHSGRIIEAFSGRLPDGGIIRFFVDVTERKRVEQMKGDFVSTVSHELRTPLTSIAGSLGLLAGGAVGTLPDKARHLVSIAKANSDRLIRLVSDILDMEKIESGRIEFRSTPREIGPIVRHVADTAQGFAARYGARIEVQDPPSLARAMVDEDRLHQVLTNLVSNAIKFTPEGEAVRVATTATPSGDWRIEVVDRGPGIPEDFRARIFQPFAQADGTDARRLGGTGLGLSIAKSLVERMGGRIGFESASGQGTRFYVDLPMHEET